MPLIKLAGGKTCLLKDLLPLINATPHTCFVEVFGGGLATILAKDKRQGAVEICNDIDGDLVNFYRCAINHPHELRRLLRFQINSRALFYQSRDTRPHDTDCQRAARYWFNNCLSFGGDGGSFGVTRPPHSGAASRWSPKFLKLRQFARRMEGVVVEHLSWERMLNLYDTPTTLFFLDPPYVGGSQKSYSVWDMNQMRVFADAVRALSAQWVVTVGDTPQMRELWHGYAQKGVQRHLTMKKVNGSKFGELIVSHLNTP